MAELLDFSPRRQYNMQSYICVKSLVCLDVYKKAEIVRRPKQREGWELKKWEAWENELRAVENLRSDIDKFQLDLIEVAEKMVKMYQFDKSHDIAERVRTELIQVLQHKPENPNQPRFLRRLNWVEQKRDMNELLSRSSNMRGRCQAIRKAQDNISTILRVHKLDQGKSTANVSSTDDKKNEEESLPCET